MKRLFKQLHYDHETGDEIFELSSPSGDERTKFRVVIVEPFGRWRLDRWDGCRWRVVAFDEDVEKLKALAEEFR